MNFKLSTFETRFLPGQNLLNCCKKSLKKVLSCDKLMALIFHKDYINDY